MKTTGERNLDMLKQNFIGATSNLAKNKLEIYFCERCEYAVNYPDINLIKNEFVCKNCQEIENYPF